MFNNNILSLLRKKTFLSEDDNTSSNLIEQLNSFSQDMKILTDAPLYKTSAPFMKALDYNNLRNDITESFFTGEEITSNAKNTINGCIYVPKVI